MPQDAFRTFNFVLYLDDVAVGAFAEASGLDADIDVISFREAGAAGRQRQLPAQVRYRPLTLRYGITENRTLLDWFSTTAAGQPDSRTASLVMLNADGQTEAARWTLFDAWVSGWRAGALDAESSRVAIESVVLVYDRVERD